MVKNDIDLFCKVVIGEINLHAGFEHLCAIETLGNINAV